MKIYMTLVSLILIFSVIVLSACSADLSSEVASLNIGVDGIGDNFNPLYAETETEKNISSLIFGTVQRQSTDNSLINQCGGISYEYVGEDRIKYTVTLRDDMYFSDGTHVTIDDVIFFYHFISDATYDGAYSDWYRNDIEGLSEYYYDDKDYNNYLTSLSNKVYETYAPENIAKSDYINYLIATKLEGKFINGLDSPSPNGKSWREYFTSIEYSQELEKLGNNPSEIQLLTVAARAEAENNPLAYDPRDYYADILLRDYIGLNYSDGTDVSSISGIRKVNDYSCTILFNSRNINAVSQINVPIISKAALAADYVKGNAASMRDKAASFIGAGPYKFYKTENNTLTLTENEFYYSDKPDFNTLVFRDLTAENVDFIDAVKKGTVDVISINATDNNLKKLESDSLKTVISNQKKYISIFFNCKTLELSERKALSGLCNFNDLLSGEIGRYYSAVYMPLSIRFSEYPSQVIAPVYSSSTFDAYKALNPQGIKPVTAYIYAPEDSLEFRILEEYKSLLSQKGITLSIKKVADYSQLCKAIESGEADLWIDSVNDTPTCDKFEYYNSMGELNITGLNDINIDTLTQSIRESVGFSNRKDMTSKLLNSVMEQAVECPVCQLQTVTVFNTDKILKDSIGDNFDYDGYAYILPLLKEN
ncbi:MAG: hypothetical protein IKB88_07030 [Clostridia bacterium]|nr:hypothetical protein [Clostridia bacterium]